MLGSALQLTVSVSVVALLVTGGAASAQGQASCAEAVAAAKAGRLDRAHLAFERCRKTATLDAAAQRQRKQVQDRLRDGDYAPVVFVVRPDQAVLHIPSLDPDRPIDSDLDLWLPFGSHSYRVSAEGYQSAQRTLAIGDRNRQLIRVELEPNPTAESTNVDFGEDGPAVEQPIVSPDLQPKKHKSLIPERFRLGEHGHVVRSEQPEPDVRWPCAIGWM